MPERGGWMRWVKALAPVAVGLGLLELGQRMRFGFWPGVIASLIVLWLGRKWMAQTMITRNAGIALAIAAGLAPAVTAFSTTLTPNSILMPGYLLLAPLLLWDFFVRQPHKGRFARARAERKGTLQQD